MGRNGDRLETNPARTRAASGTSTAGTAGTGRLAAASRNFAAATPPAAAARRGRYVLAAAAAAITLLGAVAPSARAQVVPDPPPWPWLWIGEPPEAIWGGIGNWAVYNQPFPRTPFVPNHAGDAVFIDPTRTYQDREGEIRFGAPHARIEESGNYTTGSLFLNHGTSLTLRNGSTLRLQGGAYPGSGLIQNRGNILIDGAGATTALVIAGPTVLSDVGQVTLNGNFASSVYAAGGTQDLTLTFDATIRGGGAINTGLVGFGQELVNIINVGLIDANILDTQLNIGLSDGQGSGVVNTGTLRASNGGILRFHAFNGTGMVNNAGGIIEAQAGSLVRAVSGVTVSGGTLNSSGSGAFRGVTGGHGAAGLLLNVTNAGTVFIANDESLNFAGTYTNNGTTRLESTGTGANFRINGNVLLAGTGVVEMSDSAVNQIYSAGNGQTLTVAPAQSIRGAGVFNPGFFGGNLSLANVVNQGLIEANRPNNALRLQAAASVGANLANSGTLRATNGATLQLSAFDASTLNNSGGTIEALNGSTVRVAASLTVNGGTLATAGTGAVRGVTAGNGSGTLADLTSTGRIAVGPNEELRLSGAITNNGTIAVGENVSGGGNLYIRNSLTLAGSGTLTMSDVFGHQFGGESGGAVLNVAPGATVQGAGDIGGQGFQFGPQRVNVNNQGLIHANAPGNPLRFLIADTLANNGGTLRASNGATMVVRNAALTNAGGRVEALAGSTYTHEGGVPFTQSGDGARALANGTFNIPAGMAIQGGRVGGDGVINSSLNFTGGTLGAGNSPGQLNVNGSVAFSDASTYEAEIGGLTVGTQHDRVDVSGSVALDGQLTAPRVNNFAPAWNTEFTVLSWGSRTGTFDNNQAPGADANHAFVPIYGPAGAGTLKLEYSRKGDTDLNGIINLADLDGLRQGLLSATDTDDWLKGDFDGNGAATIADFGLLRRNFGTSAPGLVAGVTDADWAALDAFGSSIPEPSAVAVLAAGAAAIGLSRRRRRGAGA